MTDLDINVLEPYQDSDLSADISKRELRALIQRLREADDRSQAQTAVNAMQAEELRDRDRRIAQLERVREAAEVTVTLAEQNDYSNDEAEELRLDDLRAALEASK